jgi:hypothetical protein
LGPPFQHLKKSNVAHKPLEIRGFLLFRSPSQSAREPT